MSLVLARSLAEDPASLGFPPTMAVEVAMRTAPIKEICEAYGITRPEWDSLRTFPAFVQAVKAALEMLKIDGMGFKMRARLQAEELLKTSWAMIHEDKDKVPAAVKADLLKFTIRAAGLDASGTKGDGSLPTGMNNALQINIHLGEDK